MNSGKWSLRKARYSCSKCGINVNYGQEYVARYTSGGQFDWDTGQGFERPKGFWHKNCFEVVKKSEDKKILQRRKAEEKARIQHQKDEEDRKAARKAVRQERVQQEALLQREKEKNFTETGYHETDEKRYERECKARKKEEEARKKEEVRLVALRDKLKREEIREKNKVVSIHDMSTDSLPCTLCGTTSCRNKNNCMVTSD